jgi:hypothetical protein
MAMKKHHFKKIFNEQQKQALINEIKGNLFEYLVAHQLARALNLETSFLRELSPQMKSILTDYETWLRENERDLLIRLPELALQTASELKKQVNFRAERILVIGKIAAGFHDDSFNEADILVLNTDHTLPISLKMCRVHALVNTKSAGIKSFVSKYFKAFLKAQIFQETLNSFVDESFSNMAQTLYANHGLDYVSGFDGLWDGPDLPGELSNEDKEVLSQLYQNLIHQLYEICVELYKSDAKLFIECLAPLMGFGNQKILNITCFYKKGYSLDGLQVSDLSDFSDQVELIPPKPGNSSFEIKFAKQALQLRIKPMNKFTTPSYKVNCSIRYLKDV